MSNKYSRKTRRVRVLVTWLQELSTGSWSITLTVLWSVRRLSPSSLTSVNIPLYHFFSATLLSVMCANLRWCRPSEPTGVRDLAVYPLSPTAVILSWQRPYHVAFRMYVLQTFFFNPVTLTSEWTTYYEIAATASIIASVVMQLWFKSWQEKINSCKDKRESNQGDKRWTEIQRKQKEKEPRSETESVPKEKGIGIKKRVE